MTLSIVALADFGSTFTKLTLVEAQSGRLLATAQAPTTVHTDVMAGYATALKQAVTTFSEPYDIVEKLAASSAGGGLRVAAVGLISDYAAAAARQAALNAGGKIELVLTGLLGPVDVETLETTAPKIVLFSGGTDGGQRRQVLDNAKALAGTRFTAHVIVACNRDVAKACAARFEAGGHTVEVVGNVLPQIREIDIEPARAAIHDAFIERVIRGKGLSQTEEFGRAVVMPTPEAVLGAARLLSDGLDSRSGIGNVLLVDIGGATTDVHSAVTLHPATPGITAEGLPPLPVTRSVQGDLGMCWSANGVYDADAGWLDQEARTLGLADGAVADGARRRHAAPEFLPAGEPDETIDRLLAVACIAQSLRRHCGRLSTVYVPNQGTSFVQEGLDLREVPRVIGTGGMLVHAAEAEQTMSRALARREDGFLTPTAPSVLLDKRYILAAAGLLATRDPAAAFSLLESELGLQA